MGSYSNIEWTTHTFNPWWGCTKVSQGCKFCYAEALSNRYGYDFWGPNKSRRLMSENHWRQPLLWDSEARDAGRRDKVFCASMADVFDEEAPEGQLVRLWELIRRTPNLDWQILTKRPQRIMDSLPNDWEDGYHNVWLGTSVEDQEAVKRIAPLTAVPAVVRFLSVEPLIGPIMHLPLGGISWVIVGGESGSKARPMEEDWLRDIKRQCNARNVPFFFKQWGGRQKKKNGRLLDGMVYDAMPLHSVPASEHRAYTGLVVLNEV